MIAERVRRRLRLVFGPPPEGGASTELLTPAAGPTIEFVAFAADCLVSGRIRLDGERLTDLLNDHTEYELIDVLVTGLADGRAAETTSIVIRREELLLVQATGPRGSGARRQRTRPHALAIQAGPYHVRGHFHALPGADPLGAFRRRRPMVPLTDARLVFGDGEARQERRVSTLIVNREAVDWVGPAVDVEIAAPHLAIPRPRDPLAKDLTGEIRVRDRFGA